MQSSEPSSDGNRAQSRAEELFSQFLEAGSRDREDFERFADAQPVELWDALRELWDDYAAGAGLMRDLTERKVAGGWDPIALLRSMCRTDASQTYGVATPLVEGGMSQIELVEDSKLGRRLVRKVLPMRVDGRHQPGDRRRVLRFVNEVRITSRLQHPSIPTVVEVGIDERGTPFFTMPLVHGENLSAILARHHAGDPEWTRARVLQVLVDVCGALAYAHSRGIVHRDIKPANIMVGRFGETLVMDWGLAKHVDDGDDLEEAGAPHSLATLNALADVGGVTIDGDVVGTPAFMAPEQAVGDLEAVGPATDQYGIGAILYTLLAGQHPYADTESDTTPRAAVRAVRNRPPTPLRVLAPRAPVELVAIAERAMARRPEDRYADITALADDLRAFLDQRAVSAYDAGGWTLLRLWVRRNRRLSAVLVAAAVTLTGALVWASLVRARHQAELRAANVDLARAHREAGARLVDMRRNLYFHTITSAAFQLETGEDYGHLRALLEGCPPELRDWEWRFLDALRDTSAWRATLRARPQPGHATTELRLSPDERLLAMSDDSGTEIRGVTSSSGGVAVPGAYSARFAPGGDRVAVLRAKQHLEVRSASTGELHATVDVGQAVRAYCWARGGAALAVATRRPGGLGDLRLYDAGDGRLLAERERVGARVLAASAPARDKLAAGCRRTIQVLGGSDLAPQVEIECPEDRPAVALAFDEQGRYVTAVFGDHRLVVYDSADGGVVATRTLPGRQILSSGIVAIDGRGQRVAYIERGAVCVYSITEQRLLERRYGGEANLSFPAFVRDPPGVQALASAHELVRWARSEAVWTPLADYGAAEVLVVAVSPDGTRVAATGWRDETCVWDLRHGGVDLLPGTAHDPKRVLAFSPDGERLLVEGPSGRPVLWQLMPRRIDRELDVRLSWAGHAAWSPDGRWIWVTNAQNRFTQIDLETGRLVVTPIPGRNRVIAFSPDGRHAYVPGNDAIVAIENASLRERWRVPCRARSVACAPDGAHLAAGHSDGRITLLDAATGKVTHTFVAHRWFVNRVAFTPSGERLLSVSYDGSVKVWEPFTGRQLLRLEPDGLPLQDMALSPDGRLLVAASTSGTVHLWRLP